jgi:hypothetical protein
LERVITGDCFEELVNFLPSGSKIIDRIFGSPRTLDSDGQAGRAKMRLLCPAKESAHSLAIRGE